MLKDGQHKPASFAVSAFVAVQACIFVVCLLVVLRLSFPDGASEVRAVRQTLYASQQLAYEANQLALWVTRQNSTPQDAEQVFDRFEVQQQRLMRTLLDDNGWLTPNSLADPKADALHKSVEARLVESLNSARKLIAVQRSIAQLQRQVSSDSIIQSMKLRYQILEKDHQKKVLQTYEALDNFIGRLSDLDKRLHQRQSQQKQELILALSLGLAGLFLMQVGLLVLRSRHLKKLSGFCEQLESRLQTGFRRRPAGSLHQRLEVIKNDFQETLALQQNELQKQRWKNVALDAAGEGVLIADQQGNIKYINAAFSNITGYEASEVMGNNCNMLSSGRTPTETYQELWSSIKNHGDWHGELINQRKDGHIYTQMTTIAGLYREGYEGDADALQGFVAIMRDISVRKQLEQELQVLAREDGLTGLLNRKTVLDESEKILQWAQRYQDPVAVIILDIDHFKAINDRWGHPVGDKAIIEVAHQCLQAMPEKALLGRIGGEEFLMVLPDTRLEQGRLFAEQVKADIAACNIPITPSQNIQLTCSFGVSATDMADSSKVADSRLLAGLIAQADRALYDAKHQGRNRVCTAPYQDLADSGSE